jgi:hypothetical protein
MNKYTKKYIVVDETNGFQILSKQEFDDFLKMDGVNFNKAFKLSPNFLDDLHDLTFLDADFFWIEHTKELEKKIIDKGYVIN